jgi:hypothetical protein
MSFEPCNLPLKIWESIGTPIPKVRAHLGVWGFIPSHFSTLPGAWNVTPRLHSWLAPLQAFDLVTSPRLRLRHHMALVYLVNKTHVSRRIIIWLLLLLKYDFIVVYKPCITHVVIDALSRLLYITQPIGVPNQTTYVSLFYIELEWLNDVK